jgi:hypothetical protein
LNSLFIHAIIQLLFSPHKQGGKMNSKLHIVILIIAAVFFLISAIGISDVNASLINQNTYPDDDKDGLNNQFEFGIMNKFTPKFIFDEEEHNILLNQNPSSFDQRKGVAYLYQVSPVACSLDFAGDTTKAVYKPLTLLTDLYPDTVLLTIIALYPYDYLPYNTVFTSEEDVFAHNGDVETIRICLLEGNPAVYDLYFLHVRRHGHDAIYGKNDLTWVFYNTTNHPVLYVSEGKHATYTSKSECENAVDDLEWLPWEEHCGEGKEIWPIAYDSYKNFYFNVGEYEPFKSVTLEDFGLADHFKETATYMGAGYSPEYIWTPFYQNPSNRQAHFCGGKNKADFYGAHDVITPGYSAENCPGAIAGELWVAKNTATLHPCFEFEYDRKGSDYRSFGLAKPDPFLCMAACIEDSNCASFSYVQAGLVSTSAMCYLKNSEPFPNKATGIISGVRRHCNASDLPSTNISVPGYCLEYNTDRWGSDYTSFYTSGSDPSDCMSSCINDSRCQAFSFVPGNSQNPNGICYLKNSVPSATSAQGIISGTRANCH